MSLLKSLQTLKNNKKKLIIFGISFFILIIIVDIILFVLLTGKDVQSNNKIFTTDSTIHLKSIDTTDNITKLLEFHSDSNKIVIIKSNDTCVVSSNINVIISNLKLNIDLVYNFYPYLKHEEIVRLIRLFNYRLGKLLEENGTDKISIEKLEKDFNLFLKDNAKEQPYNFTGVVFVHLKKFNLNKE